MGERLVIDIKERDDVSHVKLTGIIDEDNGLAEATSQIARPVVVINGADVERINSCGVRDWVTWLGRLEQGGADLYFVECSPTIMTQVNLVNNFLGAGSIINFYAPYFCVSCDTDKMLLIDVGEAQAASPFTSPTCRCDQCDHTMEFDDIESSYFAFLGTVKKISPNPALLEQISQMSAEGRSKLRARANSTTIQPVTRSRSPSSTGLPAVPTTPSGRELRSLLTDNLGFEPTAGPPQQPQPQPAPAINKILYVIIGLLMIAIVLLSYVVLGGR